MISVIGVVRELNLNVCHQTVLKDRLWQQHWLGPMWKFRSRYINAIDPVLDSLRTEMYDKTLFESIK